MTRPLSIVACAVLLSPAAWGYVLLGSKWDVAHPVMQLQLGSGGALSDGSASWNAVAEGALATWNTSISRLQFYVVADSTAARGDGNGLNNVYFSRTLFGADFDDAVAVTTEWDDSQGRRIEGDTIFNSNLPWNSYRGNLRQSAGETVYDLRRVALHEFGHTLGLDHPDEAGQTVVAIMNSVVSDLDHLASDDIRGAQALYGSKAKFTRPSTGRTSVNASSYLFKGVAVSSQVTRVYLTNSRLGARRFVANGIRSWYRAMPLEPGRNVIWLNIETSSGEKVRVQSRTVTRAD